MVGDFVRRLVSRTIAQHLAPAIDGIGASDLVSRESMLRGLLSVQGGESILPFMRQFFGAPSTYLWQDDAGDVQEIHHQGEGGGRRSHACLVLHRTAQRFGGR